MILILNYRVENILSVDTVPRTGIPLDRYTVGSEFLLGLRGDSKHTAGQMLFVLETYLGQESIHIIMFQIFPVMSHQAVKESLWSVVHTGPPAERTVQLNQNF